MGSYCISHLAILALSALFCHAEDCQIQCCEHPPCKEKPCGTYDATCYGFVGCSLPEECICDRFETGPYPGPNDRSMIDDWYPKPDPKDFIPFPSEENCRIIKSIGKGMYIPFIDNTVLDLKSSIFIPICMWIQYHFINS